MRRLIVGVSPRLWLSALWVGGALELFFFVLIHVFVGSAIVWL